MRDLLSEVQVSRSRARAPEGSVGGEGGERGIIDARPGRPADDPPHVNKPREERTRPKDIA